MHSNVSLGTAATPMVTLPHNKDEDSFLANIRYTVMLMFSRRMSLFLPQIFWTGISTAYWSGLIATIVARTIPEKSENDQLIASLYALSVLGVGEMVGSATMGLTVDKLSSRTGCILNMVNIVVVWAVSLMQIQSNKDNALVYAFTFVWGFMDGAVCIHTDTILGFEFDTAQDPFSVCICIQAVGTVVF